MFPYRRGSNKKQSRGGPGGRRPRDGGRRAPSSIQEMLSTLQPTTKALAQMLAGHTRSSGQLVHARNILAQAERLIDERAVDRLMPAHREEFFEQLARLKLTLADAEAALGEREVDEPRPTRPASTVPPERLRELALSLAGATSAGPAESRGAPAGPDSAASPAGSTAEPAASSLPEERDAPTERAPAEARAEASTSDEPARPEPSVAAGTPGSPRSARLRLKSTVRSTTVVGES